MTRRVDDDVVTPGAPKLNLRRIDRDVLLLLLRERIEHKGVFERLALRRATRCEALDLALGQRSRFVENPADQRGLAVIDVADKNDLQTRPVCGRCGFHMNPFARSFCIACGS